MIMYMTMMIRHDVTFMVTRTAIRGIPPKLRVVSVAVEGMVMSVWRSTMELGRMLWGMDVIGMIMIPLVSCVCVCACAVVVYCILIDLHVIVVRRAWCYYSIIIVFVCLFTVILHCIMIL